MILILLPLSLWILIEIASLIATEILRIKTGIYYIPKNKPGLSSDCRNFYRKLLKTNGTGNINEFHGELGWILRENLRAGDGTLLTTRGGVRSSREYSFFPASGINRISTFGDCLTYGDDVGVDETWQAHLERAIPGCEVLNFGTEGYDQGQMYLRFLESLKTYGGHRIVMFSIVSSNVFKPLNTFRLFYAYDHGLPLAKPGFTIENGELRHLRNPLFTLNDYEELLRNPPEVLSRIGKNDYYFLTLYNRTVFDSLPSLKLLKILFHEYRKIHQVFDLKGRIKNDSKAFCVSTEIYSKLCSCAQQQGSIPVFLFIPLKNEISYFRRTGIKVYQALIDHISKDQIHYIDLLDEADRIDINKIFNGRHFSLSGNAWVADCIAKNLKGAGFI